MGSEIIIVPTLFIIMYLIIELLVHRKERLMIIEKASANQSIDLSSLTKKMPSFSTLKIGCLLIGLGLGFLTDFIIANYMPGIRYFGVLDIACILTFGGMGLILAYFVEQKARKSEK